MKCIRLLAFSFGFLISLLLTAGYKRVSTTFNPDLNSALCAAISEGEIDKTKSLILGGADAKNGGGRCIPISVATWYGHTEVARLLLDMGVDINTSGEWKQTPLMNTVWKGDTETAHLLLSRGADIYATDAHDGTALFQAASVNQVGMVSLLLEYGAGQTRNAEGALSLAVERSQTELVRSLLKGGVDPVDVTATPSVKPLIQVAKKKGDTEIVNLLKQAGAKE